MSDFTDPFELDDDEFEEVVKLDIKGPKPAIIIGSGSMRGTEKITLNFSEEAIAKLDGWPRFKVSWNAKNWIFRIRADNSGKYEAYEITTGRMAKEPTERLKRYMLRLPMPDGAIHVPKLKEPAPHKYAEDGKTLNILLPNRFRKPPPKLLEGPNGRVNQDVLRQMAPAPNFGTRKP